MGRVLLPTQTKMILMLIPDWLTGYNFLVGLFALLVVIGGSILALLVKGREGVSTLQVDRAIAAEALVKTREAEIIILNARIISLEEELEGLTAEHRTIVGISIAKLMEFWSRKETIEAETEDLRRQVRVLRLRKDGDIIQS